MSTATAGVNGQPARLRKRGFWPIPIYPRGYKRQNGKVTEGKEPVGPDWGLEPWTDERLDKLRGWLPEFGLGLGLGPGRAPGGGWLVDVEGDGPEAESSRAILYGGETFQSIGWGSARGGHQLGIIDGDRLMPILAKLKPFESREANQAGVYKLPNLPGLELRIGGYKADGKVKQLQSVCPPTPGTDGKPREWNGCKILAEMPDAFYATLEAIANAAKEYLNLQDTPDAETREQARKTGTWSWVVRFYSAVESYGRAALADECGKVAGTSAGGRNIQLNLSAFKVGRLVAAKAISRDEAEKALAQAGRECGLDDQEVAATIAGGLAAGEVFPRDLAHVGQEKPAEDKKQAKPEAEAEPDWVDTGDVATLADVRRELGETRYLWPQWIPFGSLTAVTADRGIGKTRTVLDWATRLWFKEDFPDGSPNLLPEKTPTLWLCYDRNWWGLMDTAKAFGLPEEAILLPTRKGKPLWIPDFDDVRTMAILERLIRKYKPGFVCIDTTTYATGYNTAKANEAKLAFDPIMSIMTETKCACVAITHLSSEGHILNRRIGDRVRVEIRISRPNPEHPKRLRLEVEKTDDKVPEPFGMEFTDGRTTYDRSPPSGPGPAHRGPKPEKTTGLAEWLWTYLQPGPAAVASIIDAARDAGLLKPKTEKEPKPSISSLYDAKERIPRLHPGAAIHEFAAPNATGTKQIKHWEISQAEAEFDPDGPAF